MQCCRHIFSQHMSPYRILGIFSLGISMGLHYTVGFPPPSAVSWAHTVLLLHFFWQLIARLDGPMQDHWYIFLR